MSVHQLENQLQDLIDSGLSPDQFFPKAVQHIQRGDSKFDWVGVYRLEDNELVLQTGYYVGLEPEHKRIPLEEGICGAAASARETIGVDDVRSDPRYLACSISTQSEIVVPIMKGTTLYGVLDLDSDIPAAFQTQEIQLLERTADLLAEYFHRN
ncbi:MAG TPA: GAF domain-containing protein [bacterium]|nr:GAF domain-containing protein [bacterium]